MSTRLFSFIQNLFLVDCPIVEMSGLFDLKIEPKSLYYKLDAKFEPYAFESQLKAECGFKKTEDYNVEFSVS